jgi:hypothetical protein
MDNVIFLDEIWIRKDIEEAEFALAQAKMLVSVGVEVPEDVIPRLENILLKLEQELIDLFETDLDLTNKD